MYTQLTSEYTENLSVIKLEYLIIINDKFENSVHVLFAEPYLGFL